MTGRVALVTGATSGIGYEVARYLCEGGNDVVITCREKEKGEAAVQRIKSELPNSLVESMELDLSSSTLVRDFVQAFVKKKKRLSLLVNNAGMALNSKDLTMKMTPDNMELTMATNHLGPFLLTNLLLDYMIQTANVVGDGRIINISCGLHDHENNWKTRGLDYLDPKNFQLTQDGTFSGLQAYKNSKLCNVLFTYSLAERLKSTYVTVNAIDPGAVPTTKLNRYASTVQRCFSVCCLHHTLRCCHLTKTPRKAAEQVIDLAISEKYEGRTGKYYVDGVEDRSSVESYDTDLQKTVWRLSAKLTGLRSAAEDEFDDISLGTPRTPLLEQRNP